MKSLLLLLSLVASLLLLNKALVAQEAIPSPTPSAILSPALASKGAPTYQVPAKEIVGDLLRNYTPFLPHLATSGAFKPDRLAEIKTLGFKSILDMRTPAEGVADIRKAAKDLDIGFANIPVGKSAPSSEDLKQFSAWVENSDNYPALVYCASGNRVGLVWGMYQVQRGVSLVDAFRQAQAIGMKGTRGQQLIDFARKPMIE